MGKEKAINFIILIGIILFFIAIGMIIVELYEANKFCRDNEGDYFLNISIKNITHLCDGKEISKYIDTVGNKREVDWEFVSSREIVINLSNISRY